MKKKVKNDTMNEDEKIFRSDALRVRDRNLINKYGYSLSIQADTRRVFSSYEAIHKTYPEPQLKEVRIEPLTLF